MYDNRKGRLMHRISTNYMRGSAMTEFAVLCLVMVPMFSIMPLLGKVSDMNQTTIQASRYAAWERTVHDEQEKSDDRLAVEVSNLFFSKPGEMVRTNEDLLTGNDHQNNFWSGYGVIDSKQNRLLVADGSGLKSYVETTNESLPGVVSGTLTGGINTVISAMADLNSGANWDLEENGLYVAKVGTNVNSNVFLSGTKDCSNSENDKVFSCIRRRNAILVDSWASSDSEQVKTRVKSLVPTGAFAPIANLTTVMSIAPFMKEFGKLDKDAFGYVDPDVLPPDRYGK